MSPPASLAPMQSAAAAAAAQRKRSRQYGADPVRRGAALLWASVCPAACAALPAGQMELPDELARVQARTLPVPGRGRGQFDTQAALGGDSVRFERSADRWSFFSTADIDRATLRLRWDTAGLPVREQQCRLRRTGLQLGSVGVDLQPARLLCEGAGARRELQARPGAGRKGRSGSVTSGTSDTLVFEIRSVHSIHGTPLAQDEPVACLLLAEGRPVAAQDLLGTRPMLRVADGTPAQRQAAVVAGWCWRWAGNPLVDLRSLR